jgi:hypothetical protein
MPTCYICGEEITFFHDGFKAIPVHSSGHGCTGRSASGFSLGRGGGSFSQNLHPGDLAWKKPEKPTAAFGFVDPNATCPVCGERVFYYESPYGGRVFFDELGPPWPKHPCTDRALETYEHSARIVSHQVAFHQRNCKKRTNGRKSDGLHFPHFLSARKDSVPASLLLRLR